MLLANKSIAAAIIGLLLVLQAGPLQADANANNKLILILLDGFRWDYIDSKMAGFAELKQKGVQAEYMVPAFPSMSFPNYYSLTTGLYAESHGMVMNYMYDTERQQIFRMLNHHSSFQSFWWEEAEPIWITATKRGVKSYLYHWPGGNVKIRNTTAEFSTPYQLERGLGAFRNDFDNAIQRIRDNQADLVQIYCEFADEVGHEFGPESDQVKDAVKEIDAEVTEMLSKLRRFNLTKKVNVVIVSDHGMTQTDKDSVKRVSLDKYLDVHKLQYVLGQGAIIGVFPKPGHNEKVYKDLTKAHEFDVWMKKDIPERFHIKNSARTPPILVLAKKGYFIKPIEGQSVQLPYVEKHQEKLYKGYHGYDAEAVKDMNGIFFGFGPGFKSNMIAKPMQNVDVYNLMMHLLGIPAIPNNGSWEAVSKLIKGENNSASGLWHEGLSSVLACIGCIYMYSLIALVHSVWIY